MKKVQPLFITLEEPWLPRRDSVEHLLLRLDFGETITVSDLKEACKKEGRKFTIKFK